MEIETNVPYAKKVYDALKESIITNELKPGQVLIERDICARLQISRTPLRDGLNLLEKEGLIQRTGKVRRVSALTWEQIKEIYEIRLLIESYAIRLVAEKRSEADAAEFVNRHNAFAQEFLKNPDESTLSFLSADKDWHLLILSRCGNSRLYRMLEEIYEQFIRISYFTTMSGHSRIRESIQEHGDICKAISLRDPDMAKAALRVHLEKWYESLQQNWDAGECINT